MRRFAWFLVVIPLSTLLVLLMLVWNQEAIAEAFGPFGRLGIFVMAAVIVATDVGAVLFLWRRFQNQQKEDIANRTGRSVEQWVDLLNVEGPTAQNERVAWLVTRYGLDQADAARIVVEQGRLVQSEQRPSQQSVLLGCILALLLIAMGAVGVMMAFLKGMR